MTTKKLTHKQRTIRHMKTFGFISPWGAMREYGNTRLAATIYSLKEDGHEISTTMTTGKNRFGEKIIYAEYRLTKEVKKKK